MNIWMNDMRACGSGNGQCEQQIRPNGKYGFFMDLCCSESRIIIIIVYRVICGCGCEEYISCENISYNTHNTEMYVHIIPSNVQIK